MPKLKDLAALIRSKNAGPFVLTFDVFFDSQATYRQVRDSGVLTAEAFALLYCIDSSSVAIYAVDNALAIKITIPRPIVQGDVLDSDSHGGQQYAALLEVEIPGAVPRSEAAGQMAECSGSFGWNVPEPEVRPQEA